MPLLLLFGGLLLALPHLVYPVLALDLLLWGLFAMALDLLLGYVGLLSFGHAAFWGTSAYTSALLAKAGLPFPLAVLGGVGVTTLLATAIGFLSIRRQGIYFAMVTLAFAQMVYYIANELRSLTGGENGVQGVPRTLWGLDLSNPLAFYYAALPLVALGFFLAWRTVRSPFGHVLIAVREEEARAQALGYPTTRFKFLAFLLSAGLSALAGGLYALNHGFVALEVVHWSTSGLVVMMAILGGIGTLWGGLLGAAVVLLLRDWLSAWTDAWGVATGIIFVLVVLGFRQGIWGSLIRMWQHRRQAIPKS